MRCQSQIRAQSIVEMALLLPMLLLVLFAIIEFGWLIFAYSTIAQATRNGAEVAAQLPPYQSWLDLATNPPANYPGLTADDCVNAIMVAIRSELTVIGAGINDQRDIASAVTISYPNGAATRNLDLRGPIEITITYPVNGLTPLYSLLGMPEGVLMRVTQRRSLENLGRDPTRPKGVACARDVADWLIINPPEGSRP